MKFTLLSPTPATLQAMAKTWEKHIEKTGFDPGDLETAWQVLAQRKRFLPKQGLLGETRLLDQLLKESFRADQATANGSSLAFLAEYAGKSALLLGDAHPHVVTASLRRLCTERCVPSLLVDVVKLAHHGRKNNTDAALLATLNYPRYLVSTSGAQFGHPDRACMERVVKLGHARELIFNYRSEFTLPWIAASTQRRYGYEARVRSNKGLSIVTSL